MLLRESRPDDVLNEPRRKAPVIIRRPRGVPGLGRGLEGGGATRGAASTPNIGKTEGGDGGTRQSGCASSQRDLEATATMATNGSHMRDQNRRKRSYLLGRALPSRAGTVSRSSFATFQLSTVSKLATSVSKRKKYK